MRRFIATLVPTVLALAAALPRAMAAQPAASDEGSTLHNLIADLATQLSNTGYIVTIIIAGIGLLLFLQVVVLIVQTLVAVRYVRLVRREIAQQNRPKLVVRQIALEAFEVGKLAKVQWSAENMGNSTATILEAHATLLVARNGKLPAVPAYDERNHAVGDLPLASGSTLPFVQFSREEVTSAEHDAVFRIGEGSVFFFGRMLYADEAGVRRRIGFCRQFDVHWGRFLILDDPNYEYAD